MNENTMNENTFPTTDVSMRRVKTKKGGTTHPPQTRKKATPMPETSKTHPQ